MLNMQSMNLIRYLAGVFLVSTALFSWGQPCPEDSQGFPSYDIRIDSGRVILANGSEAEMSDIAVMLSTISESCQISIVPTSNEADRKLGKATCEEIARLGHKHIALQPHPRRRLYTSGGVFCKYVGGDHD